MSTSMVSRYGTRNHDPLLGKTECRRLPATGFRPGLGPMEVYEVRQMLAEAQALDPELKPIRA